MSTQQPVRWSRKAWGAYLEQMRENLPEPANSPTICERPMLRSVSYVCPFCLKGVHELRVVQTGPAGAFAATWKDCGHSVSVATCGATLRHVHGQAVCDLPPWHDPEEQHSALCELCQENDPEYGDPSDRLRWDHDGESWVGGGSQGSSASADAPAAR